VKLVIERLGHLGDAIAQGPDGPVYVAGMLPGEEVEGELQGDKLLNPRIVTPSVDRIRPPCAHAKTCGGCLLQHASDAFVADWKLGVVQSALAGQGLTAHYLPIITSPPKSRRRATIAARRTKGGALMGFHARASDMLVSVPNCQLLHPDLIAAFPALEALVKLGGSRTGEVSLTVTRSLSGPDVMVQGGKELDRSARKITDLFAGVGTFALPLAERAEVHAVEGDAAMIAALDKGFRNAEGLKRVTSETRDLFRRPLEPDELKGVEAVVIDPPRAGAEAQTAVLAKSGVPVIAAVSCNPVTFARDAKTLIRAGYSLDWVQVVDQFRWSSHVELVARFSLSR
jgi:23S rRNA (uracil1939-C5)-methyltransferase